MSYKFKSICLNFSLLLSFMLLLQVGFCQSNFSGVDDFIEKNKKVLGGEVIAMIWKDGKVVYRKETSEDFTSKMPVAIGASGQ